MSDATPERIWTCSHVGEYGNYFPEAVEAEGEYGGKAVEYVRADTCDELIRDLVSATNQARLAFAGSVSVQSAIDKLDAAEAAYVKAKEAVYVAD